MCVLHCLLHLTQLPSQAIPNETSAVSSAEQQQQQQQEQEQEHEQQEQEQEQQQQGPTSE